MKKIIIFLIFLLVNYIVIYHVAPYFQFDNQPIIMFFLVLTLFLTGMWLGKKLRDDE